MNTLKFEDCPQSHLGYTALFTSQNPVVNLAAINGLAGAQHFLLALRRGRAVQRPSAPDTGQKQEAREASEKNTITQTLETLTSTSSELGQRLNWLLWTHLFCLDFMLTFYCLQNRKQWPDWTPAKIFSGLVLWLFFWLSKSIVCYFFVLRYLGLC